MPNSKVRVVQRLFACNTLGWIEVEKLREQIDRKRIRTGKERCERHSRFDGKRTNIILSLQGT